MLKRMLLAALLTGTFASPVMAVINPHYEERCPSCHIQDPEEQADGSMDYNFLAEEIDPTCLICHAQECCTIRKPHESTHVSGVNDWDEEKYGAPEQLPLSDGYITCATCHYWRRSNNPSPEDYKLVRLVDISDTGIRWTMLCHDCHKGY